MGWQRPRQLINQSRCFGENSLSASADKSDDAVIDYYYDEHSKTWDGKG